MQESLMDIVIELRKQQGSKLKKEFLKTALDSNELFSKCIYYMYNPDFNFYISEDTINELLKTNSINLESQTSNINDDLFTILDNLKNREISGHTSHNIILRYLETLNSKDVEFIKLIFARSLKSGIDTKSILSIKPGFVPYFPYMRCDLLKPTTVGNLVSEEYNKFYAQLKADGEFINIIHRPSINSTVFRTREGKLVYHLQNQNIFNNLNTINDDVVIMGEALIRGINDRAVSNGILRRDYIDDSLLDDLFILIWDIIPYKDWVNEKYKVNYKERLEYINLHFTEISLPNIINLLNTGSYEFMNDKRIFKIPTIECDNINIAYDFYSSIVNVGLEGTIVKSFKNHFKDGTSNEQLKMKIKFECDLKITGFSLGTGKNADLFGSLLIESSDGLLKTKCSGMTDAMRLKIHNARESYIGKIITVEGNDCKRSENSEHYVISHCVFKEVRDKEEANTLERVLDELNSKRFIN